MKKSIAIIGEGETEWFYFDSLRVTCRYPFRLAPDFPAHSDIDHLLKLSKAKMKEGYDYVVCLLDMDRLNSVPAEMKKYRAFKNRKENSSSFPADVAGQALHLVRAAVTRITKIHARL